MFRKEIIKILQKQVKLPKEKLESILEIPPNQNLGDYAFPCFILAKKYKKSPTEIASDLSNRLSSSPLITQIEASGPYINFFINKEKLAQQILSTIIKEKEKYGITTEKKQKIVIEFSQPNTNKPQHLGHLRNNFLGMSLSNILKFNNNKVIKVNLINDRGIHICKSMLAYQKWGKNKTPLSENIKSDHFVGNFYVLYNQKLKQNPALEKEAQELLQKWEDGDKATIDLWKKMNKWVLDGFDETYKKIGINFDKVYFESKIYEKGRDIILNSLKKEITKKDEDGSIFINLEKEGLGKRTLIRSDGTSIYITQDIYLAKLREESLKPNKVIYVVGNEQDYHFKSLFKTLELLGFKWTNKLYHLSYGMVNLPSGKMKSREGDVIDADDIIDEMISLAKKEVEKRHKNLTKREIEERSNKIGLGALKFFLLKFDPLKSILFIPEESLSFEGETGPYIQYVHARISSILNKINFPKKVDYSYLNKDIELKLTSLLSKYPKVIEEASKNYKPSLLTNYLLELSQNFNSFYNMFPVLKADEETQKARLHLIYCIKEVIKNSLYLLGIDSPSEM